MPILFLISLKIGGKLGAIAPPPAPLGYATANLACADGAGGVKPRHEVNNKKYAFIINIVVYEATISNSDEKSNRKPTGDKQTNPVLHFHHKTTKRNMICMKHSLSGFSNLWSYIFKMF